MGLKRNTLRETTISYFRNLYYIYIKYEAILHIHLNQRDKGAIEICTNLRAGQQPQRICSTLVLPGTRHHHYIISQVKGNIRMLPTLIYIYIIWIICPVVDADSLCYTWKRKDWKTCKWWWKSHSTALDSEHYRGKTTLETKYEDTFAREKKRKLPEHDSVNTHGTNEKEYWKKSVPVRK